MLTELFFSVLHAFFGYSTKESILYAFTHYITINVIYLLLSLLVLDTRKERQYGGGDVCGSQALCFFLLWREDAKFFTKKARKWSGRV